MPKGSVGETRRGGYDKDLVNREVLAVCDHYLSHRRREGKRQTYVCPLCGGRRFEVEPNRGYAGCFAPDCPVPTTTDALGIIAYFEDLQLAGRGFVECLRRGYDILGLPEPVREGALEEAGEKGGGDRRREHSAPGSDERGRGTCPDPDSRWRAAATEGPPPEGSTLEQPMQAWQEHVDGSRSAIPAVVIHEHEADREPLDRRDERPVSTGGVDAAGRSRVSREPDSGLQRAHAVYEELLQLCPLKYRDREFFCERGLDARTIAEGRYGSISRARCGHVLEALRGRFADEELLAVPGFYRATGGQLRFSLYGDYVLTPYYDREGYIRTVEGRFTGEEMGAYDTKYKALSGSGVHLYVHPRFSPDEVVAFCEGAVGAMVAARYGFAVASIKGFRNYRRPPESREGDYSVLPELEGVDFEGRKVVYIPDVDVKPKSYEAVMSAVPDACEWLIERRGGAARVAALPGGAKDLDEWLLSLDETRRVESFHELLRSASPVRQWMEGHAPAAPESESRSVLQESVDHEGPRAGAAAPPSPVGRTAGSGTSRGDGRSSNRRVHRFESPTEDEPDIDEAGLGRHESVDEASTQKPSNTWRPCADADTAEGCSAEHRCRAHSTRVTTTTAGGGMGTTAGQAVDTLEETARERSQIPARTEGEGALLAAVFVVATPVAAASAGVLSGDLLDWARCAGLGTGTAMWVTYGIARLMHWRSARKMVRHIAGRDV